MRACASTAVAAAWTEMIGLISAEIVAICASVHAVAGISETVRSLGSRVDDTGTAFYNLNRAERGRWRCR